MNTTVKNVLIFVVGAGLGSFVTYKLLKEKYEALAQEEIDSVVETFSRRTPLDSDLVEGDMGDEEYNSLVRVKNKDKDFTAYNTVSGKNPEEVLDYPYVISLTDFQENFIGHDKVTIQYYNEDDTLADENEELIADPDYIIGSDALTRFGDGSEDPDIVYVRNEKLAIDYEVIRVFKSYQETVLGFVDRSPRKKVRHGKGELPERERE